MPSGAHVCALPGCDITAETYAYTNPGCRIVHGLAACAFCKQSDELIEGDGDRVVCRQCVGLFVGFVVKPDDLGPAILDHLLESHGDVVGLHREDGVTSWVWVTSWPR